MSDKPSVRKSRKQYEKDVQQAKTWLADMEEWSTEEILCELGRLVPSYTIETVSVFDGRYGNVRRADGHYAYGITFEIPAGADGNFDFVASRTVFNTLREAAFHAMKGALAVHVDTTDSRKEQV